MDKVSTIEWTCKLPRKAVLGLALNLKKIILKQTGCSLYRKRISDLLADSGPAYDIKI